MSQDFCTAICILLGNFKIPTILTMKNGKSGKTKMILFSPDIADFKTVYKYENQTKILTFETFYT